MFNIPAVSDFKNYFTRDFPYGSTSTTVNDSDIQNAISEAGFDFPQGLFSTQSNFTLGYLYLSAHFLVLNLRNSSQGIAGQYNWLTVSKGVGSVNGAYGIPQRILDRPQFAMIAQTTYGAKYLQFILPQLVGNIGASFGNTKP